MRCLRSASILCFLAWACAACQRGGGGEIRLGGRDHPLEDLLRPDKTVVRQDGIAAAILLDTSGSMNDRLVDADGRNKPKLAIAQRALADLVRQFQDFGQKNPEKKLLVGIYEFSSLDRVPPCREILALAPPNLEAAAAALRLVQASGGTPIGDAMIQAKRDLDATGMSRRHILVITDGENNRGHSPGDVANAIAREPEESRASVYFIAFDTAAGHFNSVRDAGGLVLAAASERDLKQTLDFVLTGKILAEEPTTPSKR